MTPTPEDTIELVVAQQGDETGTMAGGQPLQPTEAQPRTGGLAALLEPAPRKPVEFTDDQIATLLNDKLGDTTDPPGILGECGVGESTACAVNALTGRGSGNLPVFVYLLIAWARWLLTRAANTNNDDQDDGIPDVFKGGGDTPPGLPPGGLA